MWKSVSFLTIVLVAGVIAAIVNGDNSCGDANSDEAVNVSDAVYIINYVFSGGLEPNPYCIGDVNGDSKVNVSDAVYIIGYVFSGGQEPYQYCCEACPPIVTDVDGNVYQTILIGGQCWMKENLKVTHYRNGDPIPNITDSVEWLNLLTGAYCCFENNVSYIDIYGILYNWYTIYDSRNIAPLGWHVPTSGELTQLFDHLEGIMTAGGKMKEAGTVHWLEPNTGATNYSGFTGLPGGARWLLEGVYIFVSLGMQGRFWSSTEASEGFAMEFGLGHTTASILSLYGGAYKTSGFSIRCVKD